MKMSKELELIDSSRLSKANQISIPKRVRELLNKKSGQAIGFYKDKEGNILIK
jgi:AbrB family looped-hinge helix DNA binding protein